MDRTVGFDVSQELYSDAGRSTLIAFPTKAQQEKFYSSSEDLDPWTRMARDTIFEIERRALESLNPQDLTMPEIKELVAVSFYALVDCKGFQTLGDFENSIRRHALKGDDIQQDVTQNMYYALRAFVGDSNMIPMPKRADAEHRAHLAREFMYGVR